mmetsp:Transcript_35079/g.99473  ORF Transcript_35079/g.99473 Transcript_35079/m.99473 type:complete len:469 (-) Transcript_35079:115-1521(-)|eukprot:CAMPEP_0117672080 /NCGR_PEP_ID=MMETSP0804-20121206/13700_1 /TAXON_ID=1074897 /ORGANISM="Tetraselmis astigmatica, Strain CCMP880" /LENGTH=468 /DNA_ID=CAMNT_0005480631 /DNA_START=1 /DNA_END=1407 /DNA_ORIENTATION=+
MTVSAPPSRGNSIASMASIASKAALVAAAAAPANGPTLPPVAEDAAGAQPATPAVNLPPLATLRCCLCEDYLKAPVTLPCLHTGCHGCFLKHAGPFSPIPEGTNRPVPPAGFPCPVCFEECTIPRDPEEVTTDLRTQRLISLIEETNQLCGNCGEIAEVACSVCTSSMCRGCFTATHSAPVFKKHVATPLQSAKLMQLSNCSVHGSELEFWCDRCQTGVCQVCLLKGSHKGHSYTPVREVRNKSYESLKTNLKAAVSFKKQMESSIKAINAEKLQLSEHYTKVCDEINTNFENLIEAINDRKVALLKDAKDLRTSKENALSEQRDAIEKAISDVTDSIDRANTLLNYSNDLEIVERQGLFEARLKKMAGKEIAKEPCESGSLSVALFSHINAAVSGYGSVRGTPVAAATAHKHQLEKLVNEADKILSNRAKQQAMDGSKAVDGSKAMVSENVPEAIANVNDGSYCSIM